ncbi:MAG: TonB-dependent receptor plug domain-containing protein [Gemmatimonadaceae bacterium]
MIIRPLLLAAFVASALGAQEQTPDTARVDPVVVTATRTPLDRSTLPVAVTVITGDELRVRGITRVAEALKTVTSAYVAQAGSQGAQTSLFLRGGESKYVKVLIDGVAANDPGGAFDFASLTTDNVERIEIVRGPASVIHGADAVTGVVHIITRRGAEAPTGELSVRAGMAPRHRTVVGPAAERVTPDAMSTLDLSAALRGAAQTTSYSVALARHQSSGVYEVNNTYQNNVLSGRVAWSPVASTDVRLSLRYNDYQYNYPTDGGGTVSDANSYRVEDRSLLGLQLERRVREGMRAVLALSSSINEGGTDDAADDAADGSFVSQDKIRRRGVELRLHALATSAVMLTVGAQMEQQDQRSQLQSQSSFGPFASSFRAARRNIGAYAEGVFTPHARVTATLGARLDDNERFGQFLTGRAGVSTRPSESTRVRATFGNAFREPSFTENYSTGFVTGNPDLEPERTTSWDVGIEQDFFTQRIRVAVTGFSQRFVNMIDYEPTAAACGYSYCNVAEAKADGIETELEGRVAGPWWFGVGATFLETEVLEPGFDNTSGGLYKKGESLIRRPERKASANLSYRGGTLRASASLLAVGVRTDRDFRSFPSTPVTLPSYERIDVGAEYRLPALANAHTITMSVENLTNEYYENVFNFLTPRRTISLGLRSSF